MVMPFGVKDTGIMDGSGPAKINFDTLWHKALEPALEDMGYTAIRADQDLGALIIQEMLERLALADLVVADLTIPNGNVYYEVGIRHATRQTGCVLISADWAKPLFDVAQMRRVAYPLPSGDLTDEQASVIRTKLQQDVRALADGRTPPYCLPDYPDLDPQRTIAFREFVKQQSAFQAEVHAARQAPIAERNERVRELLERYVPAAGCAGEAIVPSVAFELLCLARDWLTWEETIAYVERLPERVRELPQVQEQYWLARSKAGGHMEAIGALEELIRQQGDSSERQGLLGGRYKKLSQQARDAVEQRKYLSKAIEHYERGMYLDLNDYYPSSNLPRLLKLRNRKGDHERAQSVAHVVVIACERARLLQCDDPWLNPTLLGAAFDAEDIEKARELAEQVADEGSAAWRLESTLPDLERSAALATDEGVKQALNQVIDELRRLVR